MTLGSLKVIQRSMLSWYSLQDSGELDASVYSIPADADAPSPTHKR